MNANSNIQGSVRFFIINIQEYQTIVLNNKYYV